MVRRLVVVMVRVLGYDVGCRLLLLWISGEVMCLLVRHWKVKWFPL